MKRSLMVVISIFLLCLLMVGCSQKQEETATDPGNEQEAVSEPLVLKVAHVEAEDRSTHKATLEFEKYVEEQSKGAVDVQIFPNGTMGNDEQMTQAVILGTIHMTMPATSALTTYNAKFGIGDMPFLFKDTESAFNAMDGELGDELDKLLPAELYNFGYNFNGVRNCSNSKRPINEPKDLEGIKMRVMNSPVYIDLFKYLGANPTPVNFTEVFTALQQGTVDGQENAASLTYAMKFHEVQKYYSLTGHTYSFLPVLINKAFYEGLPEDIQKIIADGAQQYLIDYQRQLEVNDNDEYIQKIKDAGVEVNEITPENHEKFVEALKPMYEKYEKEFGKELFDIAAKYNQ
ncbi:MAG: DctP family TRAP transporter solute-binding subunit [Bacillota bacterium]|jgi:C4-dicarboxylate-binding protein DctP